MKVEGSGSDKNFYEIKHIQGFDLYNSSPTN